MSEEKKGILMICLGNICRSPIAEAVMIDVVKKSGVADKFTIDSAAMGKINIMTESQQSFDWYSSCNSGSWHTGKGPDHRAAQTMKNHNLEYNNKARTITKDDYKKFDYIFGMGEHIWWVS